MTLALVRALVAGPTVPAVASAADLRLRAGGAASGTVERAATGGLAAAGLGWAFACGYLEALERLVPRVTEGGAVLAALCATEEGGGHPRAIRTLLVRREGGHGWRLDGRKTWVTLGTEADVLLVVASTGASPEGRNQLRVARVPSNRPGVRLEPAAPLPFAVEIGHARVAFEAVAVDDSELLPGDGYADVLKPFRTVEDLHVLTAALGWGVRVARASRWERAWIEEAVALVLALHALDALPALAPETHAALAGVFRATRSLLDRAAWPSCDAATRAAWERDRPLLDVASTVRAARREAAWQTLATGDLEP
jgi:acyl-CoA dehydrogenase